MSRRHLLCTVALPVVVLPVFAQQPAFVPSSPLPRVVLVGDSTVTDDSGWGLGFRQVLEPAVSVINTAANGRSSKSFFDEGRWRAALALGGEA